MTGKSILTPGPDHPIAVEPHPSRVIVTVGGRVIADTTEALALQEATYPPVLYIPRKDVDLARLERSRSTTYCPYKGECSYYSIVAEGAAGRDAVWTYEMPFAPVAAIQGHLAFQADKIDSIEQRAV